jgi:hypothetical protein
MYHSAFCIYVLCMILNVIIIFLSSIRSIETCYECYKSESFHLFKGLLNVNSINQLIFVMVKCGVLFEVRIGVLNII